jgi:hypothetical protein
MTFGYYDGPKPDRRHGDYVFNGSNLAKAGLFHVAALNYHELVPGHHLHLALQGDNLALPALRKAAYPTAFTNTPPRSQAKSACIPIRPNASDAWSARLFLPAAWLSTPA